MRTGASKSGDEGLEDLAVGFSHRLPFKATSSAEKGVFLEESGMTRYFIYDPFGAHVYTGHFISYERAVACAVEWYGPGSLVSCAP